MRRAFVVIGLGFGDEGKGSVVDFLARRYNADLVVRFSGGSQAAHNVVTASGKHHTFSQFGSGTLAGARTFLSRYMVIDPSAFLREANALIVSFGYVSDLVFVDQNALITTPWHRASNRLAEWNRRDERHGTCGVGVGETVRDWLEVGGDSMFAGDLLYPELARSKAERARERMRQRWKRYLTQSDVSDAVSTGEMSAIEVLADKDGVVLHSFLRDCVAFAERVGGIVSDTWLQNALRGDHTVVFEGSQGVLLDEWRGFHPYTTWSTCTYENADILLERAGVSASRLNCEVEWVGVIRTYMTRHGPGPFPTEDTSLDIPEAHNTHQGMQGGFRVGWPDAILWRYALKVSGGCDWLAITHADNVTDEWDICDRYMYTKPGAPIDIRAVDDLEPGPMGDLNYQAKMTKMLRTCTPMYSRIGSEKDVLRTISEKLSTPIGLVSFGPAPTDKQIIEEVLSG